MHQQRFFFTLSAFATSLKFNAVWINGLQIGNKQSKIIGRLIGVFSNNNPNFGLVFVGRKPDQASFFSYFKR